MNIVENAIIYLYFNGEEAPCQCASRGTGEKGRLPERIPGGDFAKGESGGKG